jgi:hypothetical protein
VSNNLLIVESTNDKLFIERLQRELDSTDFTVDKPIINDFECLDGLSQKRLEDKLLEVSFDIGKKGLGKIGILVDADLVGVEKRVELINQAIKSIDTKLEIAEANTWYKSESLDAYFSCHILNVSGHGELETLLKAIKSKPSPYADCLMTWKNCIASNHEKTISDKDFDKFWVSIYQRYDCCSKKEQKQAGSKCNPEASFQKDIWNFSHPALDNLKTYLMTFD